MVETNRRVLPSEAFDGFIALSIVAVVFAQPPHSSFDLHQLLLSHLQVSDCIFGAVYLLAWRYCFTVLKLYDKFATLRSRMGSTLKGVLVMMLPFLLFMRVAHPQHITGERILISVMALFCFEINRISLASYLLDRLAARGPRRALIVGSGRRAAKAWRAIRTRYPSSMVLAGFVDDRSPEEMAPDVARRYLGQVEELGDILLRDSVDVVLIAMPIRSCYPQMQEAVTVAERAGVTTVYLDDIYSLRNRGTDPNKWIFRELAPNQEKYLFVYAVKRLLDVLGAGLALVLFSPVMLGLAATIRLTSAGPAIEREECFGLRRRRFQQLSFRATSAAAEAGVLAGVAAEGDSRPVQPVDAQQTLTPVGRLLRRTSLEKLPQLWNVLLGEMSLVGPQALSVRSLMEPDQTELMRHFSVRPGITGIRQLSGPDESGAAQVTALDNHYLDGYSLLLDIKILIRAVGSVLKRCSA